MIVTPRPTADIPSIIPSTPAVCHTRPAPPPAPPLVLVPPFVSAHLISIIPSTPALGRVARPAPTPASADRPIVPPFFSAPLISIIPSTPAVRRTRPTPTASTPTIVQSVFRFFARDASTGRRRRARRGRPTAGAASICGRVVCCWVSKPPIVDLEFLPIPVEQPSARREWEGTLVLFPAPTTSFGQHSRMPALKGGDFLRNKSGGPEPGRSPARRGSQCRFTRYRSSPATSD